MFILLVGVLCGSALSDVGFPLSPSELLDGSGIRQRAAPLEKHSRWICEKLLLSYFSCHAGLAAAHCKTCSYTYTFTVSSGKVYQITDTSCGNNPDVIGARETIWYQPANPTHFLTANAWTFDWLFFLGFSIPMLLFAYAFLRGLLRRLFAPTRRLPEGQRGFSPDIYMTSMAGINPVVVRREERPEMEAIRQALLSGDKIKAITLYRSVYGGSLREAEAALGLLPPFR